MTIYCKWGQFWFHVDFSISIAVDLTLPEGEEDDWFDHEELEHGPVGTEEVSGGEVEQEKGVERQADGDIVDDGHIQVTTSNTVGSETKF